MGLVFMVTVEGTWIVLPGGDRPPLTTCPCCNKPFATKLAARRAAAVVYPQDVDKDDVPSP